jgi:hypothetical protein
MTNNKFWTTEVEEALAKYVSCVDIKEKNEIFTKYLYSPFQQLIDKTIKRYRPDREGYDDEEAKEDFLYHLVIHVQRFNPDVVLPSGRKPSGLSYCSVIIRSAIADDRVRSAREKMNRISFDDWHKDHQEI